MDAKPVKTFARRSLETSELATTRAEIKESPAEKTAAGRSARFVLQLATRLANFNQAVRFSDDGKAGAFAEKLSHVCNAFKDVSIENKLFVNAKESVSVPAGAKENLSIAAELMCTCSSEQAAEQLVLPQIELVKRRQGTWNQLSIDLAGFEDHWNCVRDSILWHLYAKKDP